MVKVVSMPVRVETWSTKTDEKVSTTYTNHGKPNSQKWLTKHMSWACRNGMGVVVRPVSLEEYHGQKKANRDS